MNEIEEIYISTETQRFHKVRHLGLVIFLASTLVIVIASLWAALSQG